MALFGDLSDVCICTFAFLSMTALQRLQRVKRVKGVQRMLGSSTAGGIFLNFRNFP